MDCSDGVVGSLFEIARQSNLDIVLNENQFELSPFVIDIANTTGIDKIKLALSWGDWQLITSISDDKLPIFKAKMRNLKKSFHVIGKFHSGAGKVFISYKNKVYKLRNFENERFSNVSYFMYGLDGYIEYLRNFQFIDNT